MEPERDVGPPRKLVLLWAVLAAVLAQAPNWWARASVGSGEVFIGSLAPWAEDVTYHLSFAEQARRGAILFEDKYNGDRIDSRLIANPYFLLLGRGARLARLEVTDAALIARLLVAVLLLLSAYSFASRFLNGRTERLLFMLLAPLGSGLGWISAWGLAGPFDSLDLWALEVSTLRAMADDVIAPLTTAVLLWVLSLIDRALAGAARGSTLAASLAALLLGTIHPHDLLVTVYVVATIVALLRATTPGLRPSSRVSSSRGRFDPAPLRVLCGIVFGSAPILVYDAYVLWREPLFWNYVRLDDSFHPATVAAGLGIPLGLSVLALPRALRSEPSRFLLPAVWLGSAAVLLFVPVPPCRQFFLLHGVQIGLSIPAALLLVQAWRRGRSWAASGRASRRAGAILARCGLVALVLGSCLTSAVHAQQWVALLQTRPADRFVPSDLASTLRWLGRHATPSSTLLAAEGVSRLAPALAGLRVVAAQEQQTVDYSRWKEIVGSALAAEDVAVLSSSLSANGVDFVLVGPEEEAIGGPGLHRRLEHSPCRRRVLTQGRVSLYQCGAPAAATPWRDRRAP